MITEEKIMELERKGFKRWTKGSMDRLYIESWNLGLVCQYYKTGNIRDAWFDGARVSNCEARRMKSAKTFIDIKTGTVHSDNNALREAAERLASLD